MEFARRRFVTLMGAPLVASAGAPDFDQSVSRRIR